VTAGYAVYWQPGCTSCLKAKEFLARHGIAFESINVRAVPGAVAALEALGARSVPVIARGAEWTSGQDLDELAHFLGVAACQARLPEAELGERLTRLLAAARRYTGQLPQARLEALLPGRDDRAGIDLACHVAMIVVGFLDAAGGGCLALEHFTRRPQGAQRTRAWVLALQDEVQAAWSAWRAGQPGAAAQPSAAGAGPPAWVETYYGRQPLQGLLERTAWHVAQHCRQLESLLREASVGVDGPLTDRELGGLPLPEGLWDEEVGAPG
jgi:glutaredoxin